MRIIVIGGGISGLTTAVLAQRAGHDVMCVEPGMVAGGLVRSETQNGFVLEAGPQAFLDDAPDTMALVSAMGLEPRLQRAAAQAKRRFIYARGKLRPVPMSPGALVKSGLLSPGAKLRLLREPFVAKRALAALDDDGETVTAFGARRLGPEAAKTLLGTAVIGIYAGDADGLSLASAFPRIAAMEREHGSLFRGLMAGRKAGRKPGHPLSFPDGLGELTTAMARTLAARLVRARATALTGHPAGGFRVTLDGPMQPHLDGDAVVVATDAETAARLLTRAAPAAAAALTGIPTAPIAVCALGFQHASAGALGMDLNAYGFLVARGEAVRMLGCQYESSIFAGRAPTGGALLRTILGGTGPGFEPDIVRLSDDEIGARAVADLRTIAGLSRDPDVVRVWRYPAGIPQYAPGHARRVATVDAALASVPGLHVLGHALRGVGINESIRAATTLIRTLGPTR